MKRVKWIVGVGVAAVSAVTFFPLTAFAATLTYVSGYGGAATTGNVDAMIDGNMGTAGTIKATNYVVFKLENTTTAVSVNMYDATATDTLQVEYLDSSGSVLRTWSPTIPNSGYQTVTDSSLPPAGAVNVKLLAPSSDTGAVNVAEIYQGTDGTPPVSPTGLTATVQSTSSVSLAWSAESSATSYNVYENGSSTPLVTGVTGTTYTVTGLQSGTQYTFNVASVNSSGTSAFSNTVTVTTGQVPAAPTLSGTASSGQTSLSWTSVSGATEYTLYRDGSVVASGLTSTSYVDTGLVNGTAYSYTVEAVNGYGSSSQSNAVSLTPSVPATPISNLSASGGRTSLALTWQGNGSPFTVTWADASGNPLGSGTSSTDSYSITGLSANTDYQVTVTDSTGAKVSGTFNTGNTAAIQQPNMPSVQNVVQNMLNMFGTSGKNALVIIGAAVSLGIIAILALYAWRLSKKWLRSSK